MYKPVAGGSSVIIQDVECHIPPVGYIRDPYNPDKLIYVGVETLSATDYHWVRQGFPDKYKLWSKEEASKQVMDPGYVHPQLEEFRSQSWIRRLAGMWFYNTPEKKPVYITGLHWYYLEWFFIGNSENNGYPFYWESDREFFYFQQHVIENPNCYGSIYLTKRREGKTAKSAAFLLEPITRMLFANGGIQSKTEGDAKKIVYADTVLRGLDKLPDFFKPVYDLSGGPRPKERITLSATPLRGKKGAEQNTDGDLGGWIDWRSSTDTAYDGAKLKRYLGDEIFKTEGVDIEERHRIVAFTVVDFDKNITGKILYTSTCEEIEGAIETYVKFWKGSDQRKINPETGQTKTGLFRYFLKSSKARNRDKYGIAPEAANRERIAAERAAVADDPVALNSLIRKEPEEVEEAFRQARKQCVFNTTAINNQMDAVLWADEEPFEEGNLIETNGTVSFVPQAGGRFVRRKGFHWPTKIKHKVSGQIEYPADTDTGVIGADPYDHKIIERESKGSGGALIGFAKWDPMHPDDTDTIVIKYLFRPETPEQFYHDAYLLAKYLGWKIVVESNRAGMINWFINNGLENYLVKVKGRSGYGVPGHVKTTERIVALITSLVHRAINKVVFLDVMQDWLLFDPKNTQKFDLTMATGYALIGESGMKDKETPQEELSGGETILSIFGRPRI